MSVCLALAVSTSACESCVETPAVAPTEDARPTGDPKTRVATDVMVGGTLGNAVALSTSDGDRLAATLRGSSRVVEVDERGKVRELDVVSKALGGVTALPSGELAVLEVKGDRVFKIALSGDDLMVVGELQVGEGPRLLAVGPGDSERAWVLTRDRDSPLVEFDWNTMKVLGRSEAGKMPADIVMDASETNLVIADLEGAQVLFKPVDGGPAVPVEVSPKPYLLVPSNAGGKSVVVVLHSNSPHLTLLEGPEVVRSVGLDFVPAALALSDSSLIYALSPGSGKLALVDAASLEVRATIDVPVGSSDVIRDEVDGAPRILVSTEMDGHVLIFAPEGQGLKEIQSIAVGAAVGRIYLSASGQPWVVGPSSGRVMHLDLK
jgi:DNA-binding beta-propeller fold protein YncE